MRTASDPHLHAIAGNVKDSFLTIEDPSSAPPSGGWKRALSSPYDRAAEGLFGYLAGAVVGHSVNMLTVEPYHSEHDGRLARYVRTGQARTVIGREASGRASLPPAGRNRAESLPMRSHDGLRRLNDAISDYQAVGVSDEEAVALATVKAVVEEYRRKLAIAQESAEAGRKLRETNKVVKIDDTPALEVTAVLERV